MILGKFLNKSIIKIGRLAGQYGKPRTESFSIIGKIKHKNLSRKDNFFYF